MIVDAGKSLFKSSTKNSGQAAKTAAKGIGEAYVKMGYAAVAASSRDLIAGQAFIDEFTEINFPWIAANIFKSEGAPLFPFYRLEPLGDLTVGIIGLSDEHNITSGYTVKSYKDVLPALLETLSDKCNLILLLSNYPQSVNRDIAHQFPEIDIIVSSDRNAGKMAPQVIRNTLMTQTSSRGKYLGRIDIDWQGKGFWFNQKRVPLDGLKKRQQEIREQLHTLSEEDPQEIKYRRKIGRLKLQEKRLAAEIAERVTLEEISAGQAQNGYKVSFLPVKPTTYPKEIESIVTKTKAELQALKGKS